MRYLRPLCLVSALLIADTGPVLAMSRDVPSPTSPNYPGAPRPVYDDPVTPYPMNYSEEVARSLGTHDGGIDFTSGGNARDGYAPAVSMSSGAGSPMLKLQWHPGE